jgi:hypothetical protein
MEFTTRLAAEDPLINQTIANYPFNQGDILSNEEILILQSYFNAFKNENFNAVEVSEYYLNEINKLNITEEAKPRCSAFLSFNKDILIYFDDNTIVPIFEDKSHTISLTSANPGGHYNNGEWIPSCSYRDCHDCCMYRKAYHLEHYAGFIEQVEFIIGLPGTFL